MTPAIYRRSLPLATRALRISQSPLGNEAGLRGAGFMVVDELFSRERLGRWILAGTPAGRPELAADVLAAETHRNVAPHDAPFAGGLPRLRG